MATENTGKVEYKEEKDGGLTRGEAISAATEAINAMFNSGAVVDPASEKKSEYLELLRIGGVTKKC